MFGLKNVSDHERIKMGGELVSELKDFLPELQNLEDRLDNIKSPSNKNLKSASNASGSALRKCFTHLLTGLNKRRNIFNITSKHIEEEIQNSPEESPKREVIRNEIERLKVCMEAAKNTPCRIGDHTDILNIYWYSKAELDIAESVNCHLDFFDHEIDKLEHSK